MSPCTAAAVALALLSILGLLGFGWRIWLQRRRTGSYGFHGVSGRVGSVEWLAGASFVVAVAVAGIGLTVWAQLHMGDSWRIGVDTEETTQLVHNGILGLVRNPIYSAMLIFEFGIAALATNPVTVAGFLLALGSLELQVRRVEEPHLLAKHDASYRDYAARVGRFVPGVGLIR